MLIGLLILRAVCVGTSARRQVWLDVLPGGMLFSELAGHTQLPRLGVSAVCNVYVCAAARISGSAASLQTRLSA